MHQTHNSPLPEAAPVPSPGLHCSLALRPGICHPASPAPKGSALSSCPGQLVTLSMSPPPPEGKTDLCLEPAPARKSLVVVRGDVKMYQGNQHYSSLVIVTMMYFLVLAKVREVVLSGRAHSIDELFWRGLRAANNVLCQMQRMIGQTSAGRIGTTELRRTTLVQ